MLPENAEFIDFSSCLCEFLYHNLGKRFTSPLINTAMDGKDFLRFPENSQYDWAFCVPQFEGRFQVRIMMGIANLKGQKYYETAFDLANWIVSRA